MSTEQLWLEDPYDRQAREADRIDAESEAQRLIYEADPRSLANDYPGDKDELLADLLMAAQGAVRGYLIGERLQDRMKSLFSEAVEVTVDDYREHL